MRADPRFPCTPAEAKRIADRHHLGSNKAERAHPLDGKSVAQWVAEARAGWPKVPVPGDPYKAAQRVLKAWADVPEKQGGLIAFDWEE